MSDFDEPSRRNWEQRRARRRDEQHDPDDAEGGKRPPFPTMIDDIEAYEQRRAASRTASWGDSRGDSASWRRSRTGRLRAGRRPAGALTSPQELQLWLQKGGWLFIAFGATAIVALLVFLLISRANDPTTNPFVTVPVTPAGQEATGSEQATATLGGPQPQPTVTAAPAVTNPARFQVTGTGGLGLRLRAEPEPGSTVIATLPDGAEVEQVGQDSTGADYVWRRVRVVGSGEEGWVAVQYLQPLP